LYLLTFTKYDDDHDIVFYMTDRLQKQFYKLR